MARSIASQKITIKTTGSYKNTLTDSTEVSVIQPALNYSASLTNGVNANMANRAWQCYNKSLAKNAQVIIDLNAFAGFDIGGGEGKDALGQAMDLEEIVLLVIKIENAVGVAGQLEVKSASDNGWALMGTYDITTGNALRGQGVLLMHQPAEQGFVVASGASRITLRARDATVLYSVYILGRSDTEESSSSSSSQSSTSQPSSSSLSVSESSQSTSSSSESSSSSQSASESSSSLSI